MEKRIYKFKNSTITIVFGDIITSNARVIVSSDDNELTMSGGVSKRIRQGAGPFIEIDTQKVKSAHIGDVIVTTAGQLKQEYIFHCTTIEFGKIVKSYLQLQDITTQEDLVEYVIKRCIDKCFRLLNALDIDSVAFPILGSGVAHMPFEQVGRIMAESLAENLSVTSKSYNVEVYILDIYNKFNDNDYICLFESFASQSSLLNYRQKIEDKENNIYCNNNKDITEESIKQNLPTDSHDVFISYSRKNAEIADKICNLLDANKITYWIDREGLFCSANYKDYIVDAINNAKAVIFLSSIDSNSSANVKREISYAVTKDKPILPLMLDNSPFAKSIAFDISYIHQIDLNNSQNWEKELLSGLSVNLVNATK